MGTTKFLVKEFTASYLIFKSPPQLESSEDYGGIVRRIKLSAKMAKLLSTATQHLLGRGLSEEGLDTSTESLAVREPNSRLLFQPFDAPYPANGP